MFPVRCFTCGKVIGDKWDEYAERVASGEPPGKVLDDLGIDRYCCRRMFLTHVDLTGEFSRFAALARIDATPESPPNV